MNMFLVRLLLASTFIIIITVSFPTSASGSTSKLPDDEVQALRDIFKTLGKTDWNFSPDVDPCDPLRKRTDGDHEKVNVSCSNCLVNGGGTESYHVVAILLKGQNLSGTLPPNLVKLPCLRELDLTRNYLTGPIPMAWGSMQQLESISLGGNRLNGIIPKDLANITTLKSFFLLHRVVEFNQLSGNLPQELGTMRSIERLFLSSNNFTGELPRSFANLTTLKDLRISDLNGSNVTFPISIIDLSRWTTLILRNCNLTGQLPNRIHRPALGDWTSLSTLDLSFNRLTGEIPSAFEVLKSVEHIYLTGNLLTGRIPDWILGRGKTTDLSYNNFTEPSPNPCQENKINLFNASSLMGNETSSIVSCLRRAGLQCPKKNLYKLHINCGGDRVTINKSIVFDADMDEGGPSNFFQSTQSYWSFSSTGHFMNDARLTSAYILSNVTRFPMNTTNPKMYMDARFSPLSLTYYAFCLVSGNYIVRLHFAEIVFTDDETYKSLGRRIFDVYVQGQRVLKDFDIVTAAGGALKPNIQNFTAVVSGSTLEIRFYWAGKGTTDIPSKGDYGPLISAISINLDHEIPSSISAGAVVGIIIAGVFVIILYVVAILWRKGYLRRRRDLEHDLRGLDLKTGTFTLRQIKTATNNFDAAYKIGEGGFGSVYKGLLSDGTIIAVKQLSSKSKQGNREFLNEIGMISALQHPHLVKLYGCCVEGNQLLLVYEYMENNSLARALFGQEESQLQLDWPARHRICVGIARGLAYLHEESRLKIVHRDIKATNVLLDRNLNPKISDFGMAKLDDEDNTHISTRVAGTYGYMAPEYAMRGYLTDKADVYSFGIVALEIVSGKSNTCHQPKGESLHLLDWALVLKEKGNLLDLVDPRLGSNYKKEEVMGVINVALLCANVSATVRPTMSSVVSMLEGGTVIPELGPNLSIIDDEMKVKALWVHFQDKKESTILGDSQTKSLLKDDPFTGSSTSAAGDLYPVHLDSSYLDKRV